MEGAPFTGFNNVLRFISNLVLPYGILLLNNTDFAGIRGQLHKGEGVRATYASPPLNYIFFNQERLDGEGKGEYDEVLLQELIHAVSVKLGKTDGEVVLQLGFAYSRPHNADEAQRIVQRAYTSGGIYNIPCFEARGLHTDQLGEYFGNSFSFFSQDVLQSEGYKNRNNLTELITRSAASSFMRGNLREGRVFIDQLRGPLLRDEEVAARIDLIGGLVGRV